MPAFKSRGRPGFQGEPALQPKGELSGEPARFAERFALNASRSDASRSERPEVQMATSASLILRV